MKARTEYLKRAVETLRSEILKKARTKSLKICSPHHPRDKKVNLAVCEPQITA
jgi:hypothetical protein